MHNLNWRTWKPFQRTATILATFAIVLISIAYPPTHFVDAATAVKITLPWNYNFSYPGILNQTATEPLSGSAYWWLSGGGQFIISSGTGKSLQGNLSSSNSWYGTYAKLYPTQSDNGSHPQNMFSLFLRTPEQNTDQSVYVKINKDNLTNSKNIHAWNGILLNSRWQDSSNYIYAGIRQDGHAVIRKVVNGVNYTLADTKIFDGTYSTSNPDLLPKNVWLGVRSVVYDDASGNTHIELYTDVGQTDSWTQILSVIDTGTQGAKLSASGLFGIRSDFMDVELSNYKIATPVIPVPVPDPAPTPTNYDALVLASNPVMYLTMANASSGKEIDQSGRGNNATYKGGSPTSVLLPNGDSAADFNGSSEYLTVPSSSDLSISTTHQFTWEAWIRPDTLQFPNDSGYGYIDWMGKCESYGPTCEWESRMYSTVNAQGRANRLSAYVFNPSAGLGSAADWQPNARVIASGQWIHVVGEYQTLSTPSGCSTVYPGSINIWVNGVKWNQSFHMPTGCMSQYSIIPKANNSALNIGTMALETWFKGAIGKVAIYNRLLSEAEIDAHYQAMTGKNPTGSCSSTCSF